MSDWTSVLHSLAGALLGAGAAIASQLIFAANSRAATKKAAHLDHRKWARDLAAQAHDGYIVEFERLTPFYGISEGPLAPDWMTGLHLKLQRMRLVCSKESVALAHSAMHALERFNEKDRYQGPSEQAWQPVQAAFDTYLTAARRDLGLQPHEHPEPLPRRILDHTHLPEHIHGHHAHVEHRHGHHQGAAAEWTPVDYQQPVLTTLTPTSVQ